MVSKAQRHRDKIICCIAMMEGIEEDRYGNLLRPDGKRYHPKTTAMSKQVKLQQGWVNIWSAYFKDLDITDDGKLKVLKTI